MPNPLTDAIRIYLHEGPHSTVADTLFEQLRQIAAAHAGPLHADELVSFEWERLSKDDNRHFRRLAGMSEADARSYVHTMCANRQIAESKGRHDEPYDDASDFSSSNSSHGVDLHSILTPDELFMAWLKVEGLTAEEIADVVKGRSRHVIYRGLREIKRKIREALKSGDGEATR